MNLWREQHVECEVLLEVSGTHAPDSLPADSERNDRAALGVESSERGVPRVVTFAKDQPRIRVELDIERTRVDGLPLSEPVDQITTHVHCDDPGVELVDRNPATFVGLRLEPERIGTNAEIRVHRNEDERVVRILISEVQRHLQDEAVHLARPTGSLRHLGRNGHPELTAGGLEGNALIQGSAILIAKLVENARDVPRVLPQLAQLFFELIDLFDHEDR